MEDFAKLDKLETDEVIVEESDSTTDFKKAALEAAKSVLKENKDLVEVLEANSEAIELRKIVVYTDTGNIMNGPEVKRKNGTMGPQKISIPMKVGAIIANVGKAPFQVMQRKYQKDANGKFVLAGEAPVALAPGKEIMLTQRDLVKFCSLPSISMKMKDGVTLVPSGRVSKDSSNMTLDEVLSGFYIKFAKEDKRTATDTKIQVQIGEKTADGWVVKPEYQEIFGYLMNAESKVTAKAAKAKVSQNAQNALYLSELLKQAGENVGSAPAPVSAPASAPASEPDSAPADAKAKGGKKKA